MSRNPARRAILMLGVAMALASPATAAAYTVTVTVHGAGKVDDIDRGAGFDCTVATPGKSSSSSTQCVLGDPSGVYNYGNIVELAASVPAGHHDRGWRFTKWVDSNAGGGRVNCDPQDKSGDHLLTNCKFQIFENLRVDLYFTDTEGPQDTTIDSGPATPTKSTSAQFTFGSGDPDAGYECLLDPPGAETGAWYACGTTTDKSESYTGLSLNGQYTFRVRGKDASGNVDGTPAAWTWTVDTVAPTATITGTPSAGATTDVTSASLSATSSEGGSVACTFDGAPSACSLSRTGLADGPHTFTAQATDPAGNTGPVATRTWTVDTTGPVVTIVEGPAAGSAVSATTATFAWTANEGAAYACSLDGGPFETCQSGDSFGGLSDGPHTFAVRGSDGLGNQGAPAERAWTVDTAVPETKLLSGPDEGSTAATGDVTFEFASPESGATFECRLDGAAFAPCSSPLRLTGLTNDDHVFEVRARDAAGNADATPERRAWRVNSLDGDGDGVNRPADCRDDDPAIRPGAADTPGDGIDQDCTGGDAAVASDDDRDDDGVAAALDCDDGDPTIRPGAHDVPKDGIDQDCTGGDAAHPVVSAALNYNWRPGRRSTKVLRLVLSKLGAGSTVKVTCRGKRCPIRSKTVKPRKGRLNVRSLLRRRPLRAGSVLTISVSAPGHVAKVIRFKVRRGRTPAGGAFRCLEPGARKTTRCP